MNFSFKKKTFLMLAGSFACYLVYFSFNFVIQKIHNDTLQKMVREQLPTMETAGKIITQISSLRGAATQAVLSQNFDGLGQMDSNHKKILELFDKWVADSPGDGESVQNLKADYSKLWTGINEILQNVVAGIDTVAKVQSQYQSQMTGMIEIEKKIQELKNQVDMDLLNSVSKAEALGLRARSVGLALLVFSLATTLVFLTIMVRINTSLASTNSSLQETSRRLLGMVEETQVSSSQLRSTANRQAASSTETVVSMEEMKRLLSQTSRVSGEAVDLSSASFSEATNGKDLIQNLKDAMSEIERLNIELEDVNQVVKQIREKTNVINDIVFKTQLLSFNANIEAARAGQHGLGFAVVANEMGSLADMSGKAAAQINELLDRSTNTVESTISRTKDKIHKANDLSAKCYEFFKILTDRSGQLKTMVSSINSAAAEQNNGVEHVVSAMSELNYTASETDKMAQALSSLAGAIKDQSLTLTTAVDSLALIVRGSSDGPSTPTLTSPPSGPASPASNPFLEIGGLPEINQDKISRRSA